MNVQMLLFFIFKTSQGSTKLKTIILQSTYSTYKVMMMSSNGNIFRITGPLRGEFTGPVNSPHKGQWRGALMFSLICTQINDWVNNREAGDLRCHGGHYDVSVMCCNVHENHLTHLTFPMARPKCLMRDFTNLNRRCKAHQTNVWWIMNVFQVHWC